MYCGIPTEFSEIVVLSDLGVSIVKIPRKVREKIMKVSEMLQNVAPLVNLTTKFALKRAVNGFEK